MALPGVDVADEIARINQGEGSRLSGNRWLINGRVYVDKGDGAAYPESGERVISPSRLELIGLKHLIKSGGDADDLRERTRFDPNFDDRIRRSSLDLYAVWKEAREEPA